MKKRIFVISLFSLMLGMLFSQTQIVLWHSYRGDEKAAINKVVANFNAEHNTLKIKALAVPFDAFPDKITAAIPRGKGPDIFIFAHDRIGGWVEGNVIESLDYYLDDDISENFVEGAYKPMVYEESLYGLPMAVKSIVLYYNTDLLKNPPKTTDEMIAVAKKFTDPKSGKYGLVYENANYYYNACWMQGFGGRVFDKNNHPIINSPECVRSFQFSQDLFLKDKIVPPEVSNILVTTLFNENKAAMVISGPWFRGEIAKDIHYKVALLPIISETNTRALPFMSSEGVMMSAKSKNKDAAFKVMKYLVNDESAYIMAKIGKQPVANKSVYSHKDIADDPFLPIFKKQIKYSIPMPSIPQMTFVWSPASSAINAVINGESPKKALDKAENTVLKNLKAAGFK